MDNEYLKQIYGLLESGATLGTGAVSGLVGLPYGLYKGVTSGAYGTPEAPRIAAREAQQFMERNTYQPRTAEGQANLQQLAGLLEASKLPPVMPEASLLAAIPKQAYAAQAERAGMAAEKAIAPVVTRTMERGGLPAQLLGDLSQGSIRPMDVWHGSPHGPFENFDPTKIGSGEGAQAFSYGHYLGEARGTGEEYRRMLSTKVDVDGKPLYDANKIVGTTGNKDLDDYLVANLGDVKATRKNLLDDIKYVAEGNPEAAKDMQKTLDALDKLKVDKKEAGYLYKVDLPDEAIANMLDWDKPYNKQPKQVQDALKNSNVAEIWKAQYGFDIEKNQPQMDMVYKAVAEQLGSPAAASQYFKDLGILGTRYLDEGSRGVNQSFVVSIPDFGSYDFPSLDEAKAFMKSNPQYKMDLIEPQKTTSNFVVFPGGEDLLTIKEINDKPVGGLLGQSKAAETADLLYRYEPSSIDDLVYRNEQEKRLNLLD